MELIRRGFINEVHGQYVEVLHRKVSQKALLWIDKAILI